MKRIVTGTTPTICYTFSIVQPADITTAIMTISHGGDILIQKNLTTATVDEDSISWTLSQAETLLLPVPCTDRIPAILMLNWLTADGTRGTSRRVEVWGVKNDINEVIP